MKKRNDQFIVVVFCIILFGVLCFYPVQYFLVSKGIVTISYDNFKIANRRDGLFSGVTNRIEGIKTSIDNKVTNYFPFYSQINYLFSDVNYEANQLLYDEFVPMGVNSDGEYVFRNKNKDSFVLESQYSDTELDRRYGDMVDFYKSLVMDEVDLYIYLPNRYEFTGFSSNSIRIRDMNDYATSLQKDVGDRVLVGELSVDSYDDYLNKFYHTDHHWNSYGAYQGYQDIMKMFGMSPRTGNVVLVDDIVYRGSMAKSAVSRDITDVFYDIDMDIPHYDVLVNDEKAPDQFKPRKVAQKDSLFYDYYVGYYNGMYGKVEYDFHDGAKENLLILGDSYSWQIDYLIASHFNKTYNINIRYDDYMDGKFDYEKFIRDHDISKILILYETQTALFDQYDYGMIRKIQR